MIGFIRGKLVVKAPPHLTVDVGGAEKTQVAHMVKQLLRIDLRLAADAADALAVAICHANTRRLEMIA